MEKICPIIFPRRRVFNNVTVGQTSRHNQDENSPRATFRRKKRNFSARRSYGKIENPRRNDQRGSLKLANDEVAAF